MPDLADRQANIGMKRARVARPEQEGLQLTEQHERDGQTGARASLLRGRLPAMLLPSDTRSASRAIAGDHDDQHFDLHVKPGLKRDLVAALPFRAETT